MPVSALEGQVGIGSDGKVKKYKVNMKMRLSSWVLAFLDGSSFSRASTMLSPPLLSAPEVLPHSLEHSLP